MVRLQPQKSVHPIRHAFFFLGRGLILCEDLLVEPEHDEVNNLCHMVVDVMRQHLILHQALFDTLIESTEAYFDTSPGRIFHAQYLVKNRGELLLKHLLNKATKSNLIGLTH
jgi:hypothetical protein